MSKQEKREVTAAAIILLLALLLAIGIYYTAGKRLEATTVTTGTTSTTQPTTYQSWNGHGDLVTVIGGWTSILPAPEDATGSNGTPGNGTVAPVKPWLPAPVTPVTTTTVPLARGLDHQCGIRAGKVFCSGSNKHGQLGKRNADGSVALPMKVDQVVAGQGSTCARGEGRVFCWGFRQGLGAANTTEPREIAVPASSKIYNGEGGTVCSVTFTEGGLNQVPGKDRGILHCWGEGIDPERGITGRSWSDSPVEIARSNDFDDVAVGWRSVCTLTGDVVMKCYGGQPDGSHDPAGRVIGKDSGWHTISVHRIDETHDEVCGHYRDGSKLCFG